MWGPHVSADTRTRHLPSSSPETARPSVTAKIAGINSAFKASIAFLLCLYKTPGISPLHSLPVPQPQSHRAAQKLTGAPPHPPEESCNSGRREPLHASFVSYFRILYVLRILLARNAFVSVPRSTHASATLPVRRRLQLRRGIDEEAGHPNDAPFAIIPRFAPCIPWYQNPHPVPFSLPRTRMSSMAPPRTCRSGDLALLDFCSRWIGRERPRLDFYRSGTQYLLSCTRSCFCHIPFRSQSG